MSTQRQIPGGPYVNETATAQRQIPGGPFINETVSSSTPVLSLATVITITTTTATPRVTITF